MFDRYCISLEESNDESFIMNKKDLPACKIIGIA